MPVSLVAIRKMAPPQQGFTKRKWPFTTRCQQQQSRRMAIYAVGEGWTGSMTHEHASKTVDGHYDEEATEDGPKPVMIYPHDDCQQAVAGWGCTAFLDTQGQTHMVGRPQDVISLFRMNRMPRFVRQWAVQREDPSDTTIVGSAISKLIGWASGGDENVEWESAKKYSLLHDWTELDLKGSGIGDTAMTYIACGAGFMALIGTTGTLYTLGLNNRGQCGTGQLSNNLWTPKPVYGLSLAFESKGHDEVDQDEPVIQVALGFQHGYALNKLGQVYSWGKGNRGQLGRELPTDQDATARPITFEERVVRVASGFHHGSLLTARNQVFLFGKNMSRSEGKDGKPTDTRIPELVEGLPSDKKVLDISCGSHHTAILMDDGSVYAVGIASDEAVPILDPVEIIPPGILEMPLRQFEAHHDRTTVVDNQGEVFQVHLWKDESLREYALFTPSYVESLVDEGKSIQSVHRGWLHTIIVTD